MVRRGSLCSWSKLDRLIPQDQWSEAREVCQGCLIWQGYLGMGEMHLFAWSSDWTWMVQSFIYLSFVFFFFLICVQVPYQAAHWAKGITVVSGPNWSDLVNFKMFSFFHLKWFLSHKLNLARHMIIILFYDKGKCIKFTIVVVLQCHLPWIHTNHFIHTWMP